MKKRTKEEWKQLYEAQKASCEYIKQQEALELAEYRKAEKEWDDYRMKVVDYIDHGESSDYSSEKNNLIERFNELNSSWQQQVTKDILMLLSKQESSCLKYCLSFFTIKIDPLEIRANEFLSKCKNKVLEHTQRKVDEEFTL